MKNLLKHKDVLLLGAGLFGTAVVVLTLFGFIVLPGTRDVRVIWEPPADPLNIRPEKGRPIPPLDVAGALKGEPAQLTQAKPLYTALCATCHGAEGLGNGPAGAALNPPPRNFAAEAGWKNGSSITRIFDTLTEGLGGMPAFDYLSAAERFALAHYLQQFGQFAHAPEPPDAVLYLDQKYKLSAGGFEPNKISLETAVSLLQKEAAAAPIIRAPQGTAEHFSGILTDPVRAARMLSGFDGWRADPQLFARAVRAGAPANGFAPGVAALSADELEELRRFIMTWPADRQDTAGGQP